MYEAPAMIGTCINCFVPGSQLATLALIVIAAEVAIYVGMGKAKI
jgi:hypothetical protein